MPFYKGVSRRVGGLLINTDGTENSSGTITATVSKDGGAFASATNTPTRVGSTGLCYLDLTSTETNCDLLVVKFTATGVVPHLLDIYPEADYTSTVAGRVDAAISSRMATFTLPTNFSSLAITGGGAVTAGTVSDKTGYSLSQAFPTNFSSMALDVSGRVQVQYGTSTGQINLSGGNLAGAVPSVTGAVGSVTGNVGGNVVGSVGSVSSFGTLVSDVAAAVWAYLSSSATTVGSLGKRIVDYLTGDIFARLGAPTGASVSADIANVKAKTDTIPASPAAVGSAMMLAADAVNSTSLATSAVTEIAAAISGNTVLYNGTIVLSTDTAHDEGPVYVSTGEVKQMLCQLKDGDGDVLPLGTLSVAVVSLPSLATVTSAATITALSGDNPDNKFYVTFTVPSSGSRWRINVSRVTASGTLVFPLEVVLR